MTEAEWLACTDPETMLEFLRGKASERKLRLFAVACCRSVWHLISPGVSRDAVEVAQGFADNCFPIQELAEAYAKADPAHRPVSHPTLARREATAWASHAAAYAASSPAAYPRFDDGSTETYDAVYNSLQVSDCVARAAAWAGRLGEDFTANRLLQSSYIRDIFGNPFLHVAVDPSWLAWNDGTVVKLAQGIYDDRAFDRLPVLADALEDADCTNPDILDHCRRPGPHAKGCWAVDLLLGKE